MANRVKTISKYSGSAWGTEVPIGADATNVDMTTAPSDYDSSSSETSKVLIGTNDVKVIASDTDLTAWGKFNRFRRRVSNKFADYFATANIKTSYQTTGANGDVYSTSLLNSYFSNVIGYTGSSAPTAGSVASQLESLNSNLNAGNLIDQTPGTSLSIGGYCVTIAYSNTNHGGFIQFPFRTKNTDYDVTRDYFNMVNVGEVTSWSLNAKSKSGTTVTINNVTTYHGSTILSFNSAGMASIDFATLGCSGAPGYISVQAQSSWVLVFYWFDQSVAEGTAVFKANTINPGVAGGLSNFTGNLRVGLCVIP